MNMIKKVARSLCEAHIRRMEMFFAEEGKEWRLTPEQYWSTHKNNLLEDAKAAIEAIREPTEFMIKEGTLDSDLKDCWTIYSAMINAALKEE